ncbi:MAG TPA: hypothetical protein VLJ76_00600 [Gaiellaceae bacterium]|nr:hypothetical protein [Gaiellaceae bacterium]
MDKVKAGVKSGAEQAATKAQEEFERLQVKRELTQAYTDLGEKAAELADSDQLAHGELTPILDRVRTLKAQLAAIGTAQPEGPAPAPAEQPPAEH